MTSIGMHGAESTGAVYSGAGVFVAGLVIQMGEEVEKEKHDVTPSHIVEASKKFTTAAAEWKGGRAKRSFPVCARNALILPKIRFINTPLIMSKLSPFLSQLHMQTETQKSTRLCLPSAQP